MTMKGKITLNYEWFNAQNPNAEIKSSHQEALKETAEDHIIEMLGKGKTEGSLVDNVRFDDSDGDEGIEYRGSRSMRAEKGTES